MFAALLVILEVPVAFALVGSRCIVLRRSTRRPLSIVVQRMGTGLDSFVLLAIPLFVLAGHLLNRAGIADRIFRVRARRWSAISAAASPMSTSSPA